MEIGEITDVGLDKHRGWNGRLVLDPEKREIYTDWQIGNGCPMAIWHKCHVKILSLNEGVTATSVQRWCEENLEGLDEICALYRGAQWDGNNHRGMWDPGLDEAIEALPKADLETYWAADEWLRPDIGAARDTILQCPDIEAAAEFFAQEASGEAALELADLKSVCRAILLESVDDELSADDLAKAKQMLA